MLSGEITDWNPDRGFGYVESGGERIFLHHKDFAKRHKMPEPGDKINFEMGQDRQGRPCAQKAVHVNEGGRVTGEAWIFLTILLGAPVFALVRFSNVIPGGYLTVYWALISGLTFWAYAHDKGRARKKGQREPERLLHLLELLGGWPGAFVAQRHLRHKCTKTSYQIIFWVIVALHQFIAVEYLRGWPVLRQTAQIVQNVFNAK